MASTYTFTQITGGSAKFKVGTGPSHVIEDSDYLDQLGSTIIRMQGHTGTYDMDTAVDTIIIGGTTYGPGSNTDTVFDALNPLFKKAAATASPTAIDASILTGTLDNARLSTGAKSKPFDYLVTKVSTTIYAFDKNGDTTFSGTDFYTVAQACVNALPAQIGGRIMIASGSFTLTNEITVTGSDVGFDPKAQVIIEGAGYSTIITQNTSAKNAFVFKNKIAASLKNMYINVGALAKSAILGDNTGTSEISIYEGTIDNVKVTHAGTAPGVLLKNFFNLSVPHIDVISSTNTAIELRGASGTGQNYGNSNFGFVHANGSNATGFAGLALISDVASHPINLCNFNLLAVGGGYYGVYMRGAASNTFGLADIEYVSRNIYMDNGAAGVNVGNNIFLSAYLYTNVGGTTIFAASNTYGNKITGRVESDDATATIISDAQQFQAANAYDLVMGFSIGASPIISIATPGQTPLIYKKIADGLTLVQGPGAGSATDLTAITTNVKPSTGNTRDLGDASNFWANSYINSGKFNYLIGRSAELALSSSASNLGIGFYLNSTGTKIGQFSLTTGNLMLQSGGTFTDNGTRLQTTSLSTSYASKSANYTLTAADHTIELTATGLTATFPTAVGCTGREYVVILGAAGTGTVATTSTQNIGQATTFNLSAQDKYVHVKSNGTRWLIIGNN